MSELHLLSPATMADIDALPRGIKGEIIDGVLYTQPRPRARHQNAVGGLYSDIHQKMQQGRDGPGGWWILTEPGIELPRSPEFSPDIAGWLKERMLRLPTTGSIVVVPDWICGVLSPGTRGYDLLTKRAFYARIGVGWLWYIDLEGRTLTVSRLHEGHWLELGIFGPEDTVSAEPFEAVATAIGAWWPEE